MTLHPSTRVALDARPQTNYGCLGAPRADGRSPPKNVAGPHPEEREVLKQGGG